MRKLLIVLTVVVLTLAGWQVWACGTEEPTCPDQQQSQTITKDIDVNVQG